MTLTLDEIAIKHGTDKATKHPSISGHGYTPHYELFFSPIRDCTIKLLEIGVGGGESIKTWLEYFSSASVYGVDTCHSTNPWNTVELKVHERYTFVTGDQSDETFWKCFKVDYGSDWDVIIDDGGHVSNQIVTSFNALWPMVKSGGLYCIEDLGVGYDPSSIFVPAGWPRHMDFIKDKLDDINRRDTIDWLHYSKELAILKKK